jgi:hypothetical protein
MSVHGFEHLRVKIREIEAIAWLNSSRNSAQDFCWMKYNLVSHIYPQCMQ